MILIMLFFIIIVNEELIVDEMLVYLKFIDTSGSSYTDKMSLSFLLVVFLNVVFIFSANVFFSIWMTSFIMETLGVGMRSVMLFSFFLSCGSTSVTVFVASVEVGTMLSVVVRVRRSFLWFVLSSFWFLV